MFHLWSGAQRETPGERPPFHLEMDSTGGALEIRLPRSFSASGIITLQVQSCSVISLIDPKLNISGDCNMVYRYPNDQMVVVEGWTGDELWIKAAHASVIVEYSDDVTEAVVNVRQGYLKHVFGI